MKAMILAAGLGTRLRPLTDDRPKALVEVGGRSLLELTLARLRSFGIVEVVINTHHHGEKIAAYLQAHGDFGMRIALSPEPILLDTGGGLKNAAGFFLGGGPADSGAEAADLLVHNVDVLSTIDIAGMLGQHRASGALATLAVQPRATTRPLLFDSGGRLCGRQVRGEVQLARPAKEPEAQAFCGIHILSTRIFAKLTEEGPFSIIEAYLRLAAEGESILAFPAGEAYWRDLGRPESLDEAARDMATGRYPAG